MSYEDYEGLEPEEESRAPDPIEEQAREELVAFFESHRNQVFFSRQIEILHEGKYFHWVTNRVLKDLRNSGFILGETRKLASGGELTLLWHKGFRYYKRAAASVISLVEAYADPNIGGALGLHGEAMVLEGFAREQFVVKGRGVRAYEGRAWTRTAHNLDFIFARDSKVYGVEVKNTLGYMRDNEFKVKIELCEELGVIPVFAVRMIPKTWIQEVIERGGFALILKWQLYPWGHRDLARRVARELGLPVDAPRALEDGTMQRFVRWHRESL